MSRALRIASLVVCVLFGAGTQRSAFASSQTQTYQLHMEVPQVSQAANGEMVSITRDGVFSVHPKTVSATGTFTSQSSGSGTWVATQLLDFQPYGCGIIFGTPIPPNLCGGKLRGKVHFKAVLVLSDGQHPAAGVEANRPHVVLPQREHIGGCQGPVPA